MGERRSDQLSSVTNALRILQEFSNSQTVVYVSELAKKLNVSKSTVSRLVRTLEAEDFLEKDTLTQGYILGNRLLTIAGILVNSNEIYREVGPVLNDLVQKTNESAQIAALDKGEVFYIYKLAGPYYSNTHTQIGASNPIHATSSGKLLLAFEDERIVDEILERPREAFTEHTITNPIQFREELKKIRRQGYSLSVEELTLGNYSLAFPVRGFDGRVVCAISISGPLSRLNNNRLKEFMRYMRQASEEASERLGYDG